MEEQGARERILNEATRLFGLKGYSATSVREVVEAAGTSKPTLYYYFQSKEGLYHQCVEVNLNDLACLVESTLMAKGSARQRLHDVLELYVGGGLDNPDKVRLMLNATSCIDAGQPQLGTIERFRSEIRRLDAVLKEGVRSGELRADIDSITVLRMLFGAADILLFTGLSGTPIPPGFADSALDLLFRGIGK